MSVNAELVRERTAARLEGYFPFSEEVIETVAGVAQMQSAHSSYQSFFDAVGVEDKINFSNGNGNVVELIDIKPKEFDSKSAMVIHLAMANPLDPNQLFQVATVAGANPSRRVIAVGNNSGENPVLAALNKEDIKKVKSGSLAPAVSSLFRYLDQEKITEVDHIGYSFGSDLAVESAQDDAFEVGNLVLLDPASAVKRLMGRLSLGLAFARTSGPLDEYVEATSLDIFKEARSESIAMLEYMVGLASPTNRAIAKYISRGRMETCLKDALFTQKQAHAALVWGSDSELSADHKMATIAVRVSRDYPERFQALRMVGGRHAMFNDVHLQAATIAETMNCR